MVFESSRVQGIKGMLVLNGRKEDSLEETA
jgi:hypothetical protein